MKPSNGLVHWSGYLIWFSWFLATRLLYRVTTTTPDKISGSWNYCWHCCVSYKWWNISRRWHFCVPLKDFIYGCLYRKHRALSYDCFYEDSPHPEEASSGSYTAFWAPTCRQTCLWWGELCLCFCWTCSPKRGKGGGEKSKTRLEINYEAKSLNVLILRS